MKPSQENKRGKKTEEPNKGHFKLGDLLFPSIDGFFYNQI
jgi:hypothetical protein